MRWRFLPEHDELFGNSKVLETSDRGLINRSWSNQWVSLEKAVLREPVYNEFCQFCRVAWSKSVTCERHVDELRQKRSTLTGSFDPAQRFTSVKTSETVWVNVVESRRMKDSWTLYIRELLIFILVFRTTRMISE